MIKGFAYQHKAPITHRIVLLKHTLVGTPFQSIRTLIRCYLDVPMLKLDCKHIILGPGGAMRTFHV